MQEMQGVLANIFMISHASTGKQATAELYTFLLEYSPSEMFLFSIFSKKVVFIAFMCYNGSNTAKTERIDSMAKICEQCGKKVGLLSAALMEISKDKILCYDCAEPISGKVYGLYDAKTKTEFDLLKDEILKKCDELYKDTVTKDIEKEIERIYEDSNIGYLEQKNAKKKLLETYMLTTGYEFSGYKIKKYIGVISGQVVLGTGFLSEFTASFADFFGEESNKFADKLETAKNAAVEKLIKKSADKGGNAIIGVDFDYITFHGNMIGVIANGTSVVVEKIEE